MSSFASVRYGCRIVSHYSVWVLGQISKYGWGYLSRSTTSSTKIQIQGFNMGRQRTWRRRKVSWLHNFFSYHLNHPLLSIPPFVLITWIVSGTPISTIHLRCQVFSIAQFTIVSVLLPVLITLLYYLPFTPCLFTYWFLGDSKVIWLSTIKFLWPRSRHARYIMIITWQNSFKISCR